MIICLVFYQLVLGKVAMILNNLVCEYLKKDLFTELHLWKYSDGKMAYLISFKSLLLKTFPLLDWIPPVQSRVKKQKT